MSVEYHQRELAIAIDPVNLARAMPPILSLRHKRILDVGCSMVQTLIASQLPSGVTEKRFKLDVTLLLPTSSSCTPPEKTFPSRMSTSTAYFPE